MLGFRVVYVFLGFLYVVTTEVSSRVRKERRVGHWGYTSRNGPDTWGGVCRTGTKQSPINIELGKAIVNNYPPFIFEESYLSKRKFVAKNNGHTVHVSLEDDTVKPVISGGGLGNNFIFEQLHLHWESEHEFDGKRADLEMHIVHYNSKYNSYAEASKQPDGIAVIAVIFNESEDTDSLTEDFFSYILDESTVKGHTTEESHHRPPVKSSSDNNLQLLGGNKEQEEHEESGFYSLRDLLPKYVSRFFRYEGSLTTPGCAEVVQKWTVLINRLPVSANVLNALRTLRDHDGYLLTENYRPRQNLNGREVYIQIQNYDQKPVTEYGQLTKNAANPKSLFSIPLLCGLILLSYYN